MLEEINSITSVYGKHKPFTTEIFSTTLCTCSREANLQLPLLKHSNKARFLQREEQSGSSKLVVMFCFRSFRGKCWGEILSSPSHFKWSVGMPSMCPCQQHHSTVPAQPPAHCTHLSLQGRWCHRCYSTAALLAVEVELSDVQHWSHPLFNAVSDAATCIYIYI